MWVFAAFCEMLFQLAVSPFNWINWFTEDIGERMGCMLSAEASRDRTAEGRDDETEEEATIDRLAKKNSFGGHHCQLKEKLARQMQRVQSLREHLKERMPSSEERLAGIRHRQVSVPVC